MIYGEIKEGASITGTLDDTKWADKSYIHKQDTASNVWIVKHNLHKFPSVTCVDTLGEVFLANVKYVDLNTVEITTTEPVVGLAYFN